MNRDESSEFSSPDSMEPRNNLTIMQLIAYLVTLGPVSDISSFVTPEKEERERLFTTGSFKYDDEIKEVHIQKIVSKKNGSLIKFSCFLLLKDNLLIIKREVVENFVLDAFFL